MFLVLSGCASRDSRPPQSCAAFLEQLRFREQFFGILRGSGRIRGPNLSMEVDLLVSRNGVVHVEISGPVGSRLGVLRLDQDFLRFYLVRDRLLYRIPTAELAAGTKRAQAFSKLLPFAVEPKLLISSLLGIAGVDALGSEYSCKYRGNSDTYEYSWSSLASQETWIFGSDRVPRSLTRGDGMSVEWSEIQGNPPSALASKVTLRRGQDELYSFTWSKVERLEVLPPGFSEWKPPTHATVEDF